MRERMHIHYLSSFMGFFVFFYASPDSLPVPLEAT